jgi:hypothetical protein
LSFTKRIDIESFFFIFNSVEFDGIKNVASSNSIYLIPKRYGNYKCCIECLNVERIRMEMSQSERLLKLNQIMIGQLKSLTYNSKVKQLK